MAPLEAGDQLVDELGEADAAMRSWAQLLQKRAVHGFQTLDDAVDLADAVGDLGGARIFQLIGDGLDRRRIGGDAEQAGAGLVVQLVGDLAALLFLHRDQLPVEPAIFLPRHIERLGQRVEAIGDDGELLHLRRLKARGIMAILEFQHAAREIGERIEQAAEHDIEHAENDGIEHEPDDGKRIEILPGLGDLVGRLADDHDWVRVLRGDHAHGTANELRPNQGREPARRLRRFVVAGLRRNDAELAHLIHEQDPDVAQMLQLQWKLILQLIAFAPRIEVLDGGGDEALSHFERGLDLDARGGPGVEDRHRNGEQRCEEVDQADRDEKLSADWPIVPKLLQHGL